MTQSLQEYSSSRSESCLQQTQCGCRLPVYVYFYVHVDIYRKLTTTDTTTHFTSTHPIEHKLAAYRYHITRMLSLPLKTTQQKREWETILHIAQQNGFLPAMIHKLRHQIGLITHFTTRQKKQEMGDFHVHFPTNTQDHELVQKHTHKDNI